MRLLVSIIVVLLVALPVAAVFIPGERLGISNPLYLRYNPDRLVAAPVKCGPYFVYIHPNSPANLKYEMFIVSRTPPDRRVDKIHELWTFGNMRYAISNDYPTLSRGHTYERTIVRPAMFGELIGHYFDGLSNLCFPYKTAILQCDRARVWCGRWPEPAPSLEPPPPVWSDPDIR